MQDILETADKKLKLLQDENDRFISDIKKNNKLGQELINWIQEKGTDIEVRKLLTHISQVEQVTNLLMLLTIMLARAESKESRDQVGSDVTDLCSVIMCHLQELLKTKIKITKQLRDAKHLRQYTVNQGKALRPLVSKYSKGLFEINL